MAELSPSQLNQAFRLIDATKRCGAHILYDAKSFDEMFRWNRFAGLDGQVLDFVRRIVKSPADAAEALGVKYPTYAGHENGSRKLGRNIDLYADRLGIRAEWLRTGQGPMKRGKKSLVEEIYDDLPKPKQEEAIKFMRWLKAS